MSTTTDRVAGRATHRPPGRIERARRAIGHVPGAAAASAMVVILLVVAALGAGLLRPDSYLVTDLDNVLGAPSLGHPLGTDVSGRDLLAMILRGMRVSFTVAALAGTLAVIVGAVIGVLAGVAGGRVDEAVMRVVDFFSSQNHLLFGLLIAVLARPAVGGAGAVMLAVGLTHWMSMARILRAEVLSLRERPFIKAAIGVGASRGQVTRLHVLPHLAPSAGLGFVLLFPHAIFHEAALSFLGLGLPPGNPSLGTLIAAGQSALLQGGWWVVLFPGLVIIIASVAVGNIGEWWRDRTQPHWRSELEL